MNKHNCINWVEEGMGCSICSCVLNRYSLDDIKEVQVFLNWLIQDQKEEIIRLRERIAYLEGEKDV